MSVGLHLAHSGGTTYSGAKACQLVRAIQAQQEEGAHRILNVSSSLLFKDCNLFKLKPTNNKNIKVAKKRGKNKYNAASFTGGNPAKPLSWYELLSLCLLISMPAAATSSKLDEPMWKVSWDGVPR